MGKKLYLGQLSAFESMLRGEVMESQYPLTAFQAAHNTLVMLCSTDEAIAQEYLVYLSQQDEPHLSAVWTMVSAELPFWQLLRELPPMIETPPS